MNSEWKTSSQCTIHNSLFTILNEPIPLKYPDYRPEMRQWRQMRQMRHFFCALVFSHLGGQQRVPVPKSRKSVAFCHTGVAGKLTLDYRRLRRGRQKTEDGSQKSEAKRKLPLDNLEERVGAEASRTAPAHLGRPPNFWLRSSVFLFAISNRQFLRRPGLLSVAPFGAKGIFPFLSLKLPLPDAVSCLLFWYCDRSGLLPSAYRQVGTGLPSIFRIASWAV